MCQVKVLDTGSRQSPAFENLTFESSRCGTRLLLEARCGTRLLLEARGGTRVLLEVDDT